MPGNKNSSAALSWLIKWFCQNADLEEANIKCELNENYFEKGWIDSFKFINLISDIENNFQMKFINDEFQNRNFATVNGLALIIAKRIDAKK